MAERNGLKVAGILLVGGFIIFTIASLFHPAGHDDVFPTIFGKYAKSDSWEAVHYVQFLGVMVLLGGFVAFYRLLHLDGTVSVLALCGLGATIASAAIWAVLQGLDGIGEKQVVDAWAKAVGPEKAVRFADASTVRWIEEGINSYFRLVLGLSVALYGAASVRTAIVARWLGWTAIVGGLSYMASGIAVGYAGFESGFGELTTILAQVMFLVFVVGVLVVGLRRKDRAAPA
jgi:hypothetical protein